MTEEFRHEYPNTVSAKRGDTYSVQRMRDAIVSDVRLSLLALVAAVGVRIADRLCQRGQSAVGPCRIEDA